MEEILNIGVRGARENGLNCNKFIVNVFPYVLTYNIKCDLFRYGIN